MFGKKKESNYVEVQGDFKKFLEGKNFASQIEEKLQDERSTVFSLLLSVQKEKHGVRQVVTSFGGCEYPEDVYITDLKELADCSSVFRKTIEEYLTENGIRLSKVNADFSALDVRINYRLEK